jgi:hypothetical protein
MQEGFAIASFSSFVSHAAARGRSVRRVRQSVDRNAKAYGAGVEMTLQRPAGVCKHSEQSCVGREREGRERLDAVLSRDECELLEQPRTYSAMLLCIRDLEGNFRFGCADAVVSRDRGNLVADERDECDMVGPIEVVQLQLCSSRASCRQEEPEVDLRR